MVTLVFKYINLSLYLCTLDWYSYKLKHILKGLHFLTPFPTFCNFYVLFYIIMFIILLFTVVKIAFTEFSDFFKKCRYWLILVILNPYIFLPFLLSFSLSYRLSISFFRFEKFSVIISSMKLLIPFLFLLLLESLLYIDCHVFYYPIDVMYYFHFSFCCSEW